MSHTGIKTPTTLQNGRSSSSHHSKLNARTGVS
ncbi:hypothetical protein AZE42_01067 [Rhizopogon vesiculosus]|uniref:Uncharacterized protein n=1 Tax=Rhizopogon vesiculosus TaxID=180088 RepID=A0A1J8PJK6_9AGAM|nr:hypothetical protein AZE42_01067 [Rhizopogon vesiculosus]